MSDNKNIKNECIKQMKFGKGLCLISDILVPAGLLGVLFLYLFYPSIAAILISGSVAIIGFILDGRGEVLQVKAKERLKNYYHNKMINGVAL